ncbi:unnamed protein product, partial [Meganyctiphanes norvegica]
VDAVHLGEDASEGRDTNTNEPIFGTLVGGHGSHVKPEHGLGLVSLDWLAVLGAIPVIVLQIVNLILLILVLVLVKVDKSEDTGYSSSYADTGYAKSSYSKRSASGSFWSLRDITDSPVVAFLTQVVSEAIDKHSAFNKD